MTTWVRYGVGTGLDWSKYQPTHENIGTPAFGCAGVIWHTNPHINRFNCHPWLNLATHDQAFAAYDIFILSDYRHGRVVSFYGIEANWHIYGSEPVSRGSLDARTAHAPHESLLYAWTPPALYALPYLAKKTTQAHYVRLACVIEMAFILSFSPRVSACVTMQAY